MASSSSKWRALQRRHKWSYDAVRLPSTRLQALLHFQQQLQRKAPSLSNFLAAVLDMLQLTSTHAQLSALKKVIAAFQNLLHCHQNPRAAEKIPSGAGDTSNDQPVELGSGEFPLSERISDVGNGDPRFNCVNKKEPLVAHGCISREILFIHGDANLDDDAIVGMSFYILVELLFLENSVPLHRSILSSLTFLSPHWKEPIKTALAQCFQEYGVTGPKSRRFALAGIASSLVNLPKPGLLEGVLQNFAATITDALSCGVQALLQETREGGRPTPTSMEECQGALSCLYYMIQYYSQELFIPYSRSSFLISDDMESPDRCKNLSSTLSCGAVDGDRKLLIYDAVLDVILDVLQVNYLSRDCCIAAGVGLCAAMQINTSQEELASMLASSLFTASKNSVAILTKEGPEHGLKGETQIDKAIVRIRGTHLENEVCKFTEFGRLCVLRGLLTAIPRPSLNMNFLYLGKHEENIIVETLHAWQEEKFLPWSILFNGVLPELCELCESSVDSHFKFHSVTALQICLQQIKTSISLGLIESAFKELEGMARHHGYVIFPYCPISNAAVRRILQIVWNNWEDPLNQTVKQIQVAFDLLVDIQCLILSSTFSCLPNGESLEVEGAQNNDDNVKEFLNGILKELLTAGGHRKGRYVPLASLSSRLGALNLLKMSPNLLFECVTAMVDDDVCCSAGAFLKAFLERLREDCWSSEGGVMEGLTAFRRLSLPPIIAGIVSGNIRLRVNVNIYALPVALQIDSDAILHMLAFALEGVQPEVEETSSWHEIKGAAGLPEHLTTNQRVALVIGLLKTARMEALIEGDLCYLTKCVSSDHEFNYSRDGAAFVSVKKNIFMIPLALLEIAVTHSEDSLRIDAAEALCLNPKTASMPSYLELALLKVSIPLNMRCSSTSFRMKWTSLFRKFFLRIRISIERQLKADVSRTKAEKAGTAEVFLEDDLPTSSMPVTVQQMQGFMKWFCNILLFSLYPSAPYERKTMSMELIAAMLESWSLTNSTLHSVGTGSFIREEATTVLLGSVVDSWDKLREGAFRILSSCPTPLPGYNSTHEVEKVLKWAMSLVNSPRVRESDAGALVLRLVFQKYVVQLGWILKLHPQPVVLSPKLNSNLERENVGIAIANFVESLNDWLEWGIVEGEKNLLKACRHSFVHGALLSYRYTVEELDWKSNSLIAAASELRLALTRLLSLLTRVTAIALWVVSADAFDMSQGLDVLSKPSNIDLQGLIEDDEKLAIDDWDEVASEDAGDAHVGFLAPSEQAIMVGCWLAMKEVSLLLGTVTRKVPLPGCNNAETDDHGNSLSLLDLNQLELIGGHFLQVLLSMKHNGAIDKTRAGFVALCNRLLCSSDARLNKMPELWLQQLMDRTAAKGQTVDDLLRRSAGIPAAFLALFLAEPEGAPKKLLLIAMRWLIDLVKSFLEGSHVDAITVQADTKKGPATSSLLLKSRDEGVVPTVHAFNVMRVTFNDTNLSTDSSGFCAEGLSVAIQAFSSHHWEVRNAAILAFTALLRRMVGFLNNQTHESARRAITGFEFFHRYPLLHSFLLKELQNATSVLEDEKGYNSGSLSRTLHPSLAPILIILSRLKPSIINSDTEDWLSPSAFISLISKCATQSNLKVRILASRALAPLMVADKLPQVLQELGKCLPMQKDAALQTIHGRIENGDTSSFLKDVENMQFCFPKRLLPFNCIHGVLLQMHSLLTYNCSALPLNSGLRKESVSLLLPIIQGVDMHFLFRCPMVGAAFLDVLQSLMSVNMMCEERASPKALQCLMAQASATVLDGVYDTSLYSVPWDATRVTMRVKACKHYFEETLADWHESDSVQPHVWNANGKDFLTRLKNCLFSSMYEVRLGVLKALKLFFDLLELKFKMQDTLKFGIQRLEWADKCVYPLLIECLRVETYPRCMRYALLNYFSFSMLQLKVQKQVKDRANRDAIPANSHPSQICQIEGGSTTSAFDMWNLFLQVYQNTRHVKTKEVAICCLGLCVQQITQGLRNHHSTLQTSSCSDCEHSSRIRGIVKESLQVWLDLIQRHSCASEPVMLRRATADAIVASGLLEQVKWVGLHYAGSFVQLPFSNLPEEGNSWHTNRECMVEDQIARTVLHAWFVCMKLLEDEDAMLREKLAVAVLHIVSPVRDRNPLGGGSADFVPAQVERVIQLSFDFLSSQLRHSEAYVDCLASWVWRGLAEVDSIQDDSNLVRRLFDKEADNHHEEGLFFIQLCFLHIRRILDNMQETVNVSLSGFCSGNSQARAHIISLYRILECWREKFLTHLKSFVEKFLMLENRLQWLGGLTNHPDIFRTLYPLLLGLLIFSRPADGSDKDKVLEIGEMMKDFVANPLILNVLTRLMQQYGSQESFLLGIEEFDPFFLL